MFISYKHKLLEEMKTLLDFSPYRFSAGLLSEKNQQLDIKGSGENRNETTAVEKPPL